ncbi:MAG TPA: hypothetical protein VNT26_18670, partial [Candidatus Sulfotelmatobacter sp.]|nr:hypothetical protein [Candidatus Sulfotelmatobacter sp.]
MKIRFSVWGMVGLLALGLAGCGKNAASVGSRNAKLFQSANPQIKTQWDTAMAAVKTNGFVVSIVTLRNLQQASLTPEQL